MMFVNLVWAWGHPEVYILVLPAFGIFSEIFSTFSGKPLFGYRSMVAATLFICVVSMVVWLHHFFTMGTGPAVNTFFGISSSVIAVGTGVKIYNWIFTMYGGRVRFEVPMLWSMGFIFTFVIGGLTGVLLAVPPADFITHNSMFLVAHFHNVIVGGVVFGIFAGLEFWFPKVFGFRLHAGWGKAAFWCAFIGFWVTFAPLYVLGLQGMTRRLQHISFPEWGPWLYVSLVGVGILALGVISQVMQLVVSIRNREALRDTTGDPWDGRSLEWATPSPPPFFNFAVMPNVEGEEAYWGIKLRAVETQQLAPEPTYEPIEMPVHSPVGIYTAFFTSVFGFAMIWYIWWLAILALAAAFVGFVVFAWRDVHEFEVPVEEVARVDRARRAAREALLQRLSRQEAPA
jgi:cytochrome o ubiquinol oxidase subunit 1